jgi:hypothetical protein
VSDKIRMNLKIDQEKNNYELQIFLDAYYVEKIVFHLLIEIQGTKPKKLMCLS